MRDEYGARARNQPAQPTGLSTYPNKDTIPMAHAFTPVLLASTAALVLTIATAGAQTPAPQPGSPPANAGAATAPRASGLTASALRNQPVHNASGQEIGRVAGVVIGPDNQPYTIMGGGTFGNRQVLLPTNRLAHQNNRFVATGYSEEQLRALPPHTAGASGYRNAEDTYALTVTGYTATAQAGQPGQGAEAGRITLQQAAPSIQVQQAQPQVNVQQAQPQVSVRQAQPEILVRQPQPTVTVDIPQPEIIVRMPQPEVNVAQAQPQVEVRQSQPQVQVVQPEQPQVNVTPAQPQVNVQQAQAQPQVNVQGAEQQPQVRYERAEPKVVVNQAQGQPQVRLEQQGQQAQPAQPQAAQPQAAPAPATTGAIPAGTRSLNVTELEALDVYNAQGAKLGEVDDVLIGPDNKVFVVMEYGGFLGLGERKASVPVEQMAFRDNRLQTSLTEAQLRGLPAFDRIGQGYRAADDGYRTEIGLHRQ